jgi:hypothetical protein
VIAGLGTEPILDADEPGASELKGVSAAGGDSVLPCVGQR